MQPRFFQIIFISHRRWETPTHRCYSHWECTLFRFNALMSWWGYQADLQTEFVAKLIPVCYNRGGKPAHHWFQIYQNLCTLGVLLSARVIKQKIYLAAYYKKSPGLKMYRYNWLGAVVVSNHQDFFIRYQSSSKHGAQSQILYNCMCILSAVLRLGDIYTEHIRSRKSTKWSVILKYTQWDWARAQEA